ncbi:TRAP transporter substrate-binding protein [Chachezhania antarctica]|uniref:TRAP transporter substrate-binding protein n=1 Tax=Chachezhania antarctica TaxID=2340860 RepID=UPI000EB1E259|nr:TRAP transporter substrate-binding protein [Chachezhania antarctica]|tara:strand:+ start:1882 stop:2874 length:993 start_codon:yes stop_codon:yes gene_type:complete
MKHFLTAIAAAATTGLLTAAPAWADEIKIAVGCPPVPACSDWVYAEDLAASLREDGLEATVFTGGSLGKDPELVDQLSQGLLQFALTNFVMINEVDKSILGFLAPYMFDDMDHFFRATQDTESELMAGIEESMEAQGIAIAGLPGLGGTMGIFNDERPITKVSDLEGIRLRAIDATQNELFQSWGVQGVVVDMPEFSGALQQGIVDGYFNPPVVALIFRHTEMMPYYTDIGAGTPFRAALMSADWYADLDDATKASVDKAVETANAKNRIWTLEAAANEIEGLKKAGATVSQLEDGALEDFKARSVEAWNVLMPPEDIEAFQALAAETRE